MDEPARFVGTAGWSIPRAHRDRFAPAGSQLQRYASRLNAAEINSSSYRSHDAATYERWAATVSESFRFAVKIPKLITHDRALVRARSARQVRRRDCLAWVAAYLLFAVSKDGNRSAGR